MSEVRSTVAMNIRRLRAAKGLSEIAVAGAAGLSRAGYRNLEGGTGEPRSATLVRVAKALGATPGDLLRPAAPLPRARFRSLKRMKAREQLLVDVGRRLADYQQLEVALDANEPYAFATYPEPPASGGPAAVAAAGEIRKLLGLGRRSPSGTSAAYSKGRASSSFERASRPMISSACRWPQAMGGLPSS